MAYNIDPSFRGYPTEIEGYELNYRFDMGFWIIDIFKDAILIDEAERHPAKDMAWTEALTRIRAHMDMVEGSQKFKGLKDWLTI